MTLKYLTAGESHGPALVGILEGLPAGIKIDKEDFKFLLEKRWQGYGRGHRKNVENDEVRVLSGMINGKTIGSPFSVMIENKDFQNSKDFMDPFLATSSEKNALHVIKPGHADIGGIARYDFTDIRPIRERASARETAIRTAISVPVRCLLKELGIKSVAFVKSLNGIEADTSNLDFHKISKLLDDCEKGFLTPDPQIIPIWKKETDSATENNSSFGGVVEIRFSGVPAGIGSHVHWDRKLDGLLSAALMAIPSVKAIEIGDGLSFGQGKLLEADPVSYVEAKGYFKESNFSGGIDGGISTGNEIVIKCFVKPIPGKTSAKSVDIKTKQEKCNDFYRSDTHALPATAVVAESIMSLVLASEILNLTGGDTLKEVVERFLRYKERISSV